LARRIPCNAGTPCHFIYQWFNTRPVAMLSSEQEGRLTLEANEQTTTPLTFALGQNYPNPFNPATTISFAVGHSSLVTLKVYNTLGEEVAILMNEEKEAGEYSVCWDADKLPIGVYMYRMTAGTPSSGSGKFFTEIKKMVLTK